MKTGQLLACAVALTAATAFITTHVVSQESKAPTQQPQQPDPAQMEQQWMKYAQPTAHHKKLDVFIGEWDQVVKMWWYPGAEPQITTSTATYEWIMDGRFVQGHYNGEFQGETFKGMDLLGYDNFRERYISLWVDNMTTAFMTAHGKFNAAGTELQMRGTHDDVMTAEKDKPFKSVTRIVDEDTVVYESYAMGPDGEFFKSLEVTSTRK